MASDSRVPVKTLATVAPWKKTPGSWELNADWNLHPSRPSGANLGDGFTYVCWTLPLTWNPKTIFWMVFLKDYCFSKVLLLTNPGKCHFTSRDSRICWHAFPEFDLSYMMFYCPDAPCMDYIFTYIKWNMTTFKGKWLGKYSLHGISRTVIGPLIIVTQHLMYTPEV